MCPSKRSSWPPVGIRNILQRGWGFIIITEGVRRVLHKRWGSLRRESKAKWVCSEGCSWQRQNDPVTKHSQSKTAQMKDRQATQEERCVLADINDLSPLHHPERGTTISKLFWDQGIAPCTSSLSHCPSENKQESWVENGARTFINCLLFAELFGNRGFCCCSVCDACWETKLYQNIRQAEIQWRAQQTAASQSVIWRHQPEGKKCLWKSGGDRCGTTDSLAIWLWGVSALRMGVISTGSLDWSWHDVAISISGWMVFKVQWRSTIWDHFENVTARLQHELSSHFWAQRWNGQTKVINFLTLANYIFNKFIWSSNIRQWKLEEKSKWSLSSFLIIKWRANVTFCLLALLYFAPHKWNIVTIQCLKWCLDLPSKIEILIWTQIFHIKFCANDKLYELCYSY